ncbi:MULTISPECIES: molecular chaperone DnaJ [unclassified Aeromicrobium]|uniref:molecular chaperone DnaJ n=1 Tax=unclassified Aeromicrobium TaxID=2633570 RepID=UPI00209799B0|nr:MULTISPECIES: molecular chaperone DnaJ [unclassified Aeromicrobium]MCO7239865.1 molecular chaperone DnaJ [Aeromicrobium sp. CnD17-E]MDR6118988.1 molecular chaperone DnaJ [Aeromicrobium sp. SORGH_AS_0981]
MAQDYYALLGVSRSATPEEMKKAYRKLARQLHPDVNDAPDAADRFKEVTTAYEVLSDPQKRAVYDRGGNPLGGGGGAGGFGGGAGFSFDDIMDAFFGGGGSSSRGPRSRVQRGQDALLRLQVDLAEAAFGVTREIKVDTAVVCERCSGSGAEDDSATVTCGTCHGHGEVQQVQRTPLGSVRTARPCPTCHGFGTVIQDPCHECHGDGRVRSRRSITVSIPAGVDQGTRIQLAGEGEVGPGGGPAGDLYIEVEVARHPVFTRKGDQLRCQVTLPMTAAALGTHVDLPTLEADLADEDGPEVVGLEVPAGIQSGETLTLRGQGVPRLRGPGRGDLVVEIVVQTPDDLDDAQRDLLKQLAALRDEERPEAQLGSTHRGSVFGRIKDAFR